MIADHLEHMAFHRMKSNICLECEMPTGELGSNSRVYQVRDYTRYEPFKEENKITQKDHDIICPGPGMCFTENVFYGLPRVAPSNQAKPDMLHTLYLGIFNHRMDWIQGFLQQQE